MAASSESYDRWAIAAPNGKLLGSDFRGAPSTDLCGIGQVWETEVKEEALKMISNFQDQIEAMGLPTPRFTLYKRTTTISTSPWVEQS